MSDPEHCYCVILNAHDGAAFPEETESKNPGSNVQPGLNCGSAQEKPPKVPSLVIQNYVYEAFCLFKIYEIFVNNLNDYIELLNI